LFLTHALRLKAGDWKGFGTEFDAMHDILEKNEPAIRRPLMNRFPDDRLQLS
jgi:hypothetical protein